MRKGQIAREISPAVPDEISSPPEPANPFSDTSIGAGDTILTMQFVRDLFHQSAYGNLLGAYVLDADGDLHALISTFESASGARRRVNYKLAAADLDDDLLQEALRSVVMTEAGMPGLLG